MLNKIAIFIEIHYSLQKYPKIGEKITRISEYPISVKNTENIEYRGYQKYRNICKQKQKNVRIYLPSPQYP